MKQSTKVILIIVGVLALGAGAYFIFRPKKEDANDNKDNDDKKDNVQQNQVASGFEKYVVSTNKGNLNLRDTPSTSGTIKQSLPKGTEILAKASTTSGWHEVGDDKGQVIGYVSSQFITKK